MIIKASFLLNFIGCATAIRVPNAGINHTVINVPSLPIPRPGASHGDMVIQGFDCNALPYGLSKKDCQYMSAIGFHGFGENARSQNGRVWIGTDGPNKFTFRNTGTGPAVTLILWEFNGDYASPFMNARKPVISYSLPNVGDCVTISMADNRSGAWSFLTNYKTKLNKYGQVGNTWGEYSTGFYGTVDVSRLPFMKGHRMDIRVVSNGCTSNWNRCIYVCKDSTKELCGESGEYKLVNCESGSQPGSHIGYDAYGNPNGGCSGWTNGANYEVGLLA